jgi:glycosyltransferase involved in cell wall biosynthesis
MAEFRDPWTDNPSKPAFVRSGWSDATERWLERLVCRRADAVITVTDSLARIIRSRLPAAMAHKVKVVRNGIDAIDPPLLTPVRPVRRVIYVGSLYSGRDPRPFFQSLARLRGRGALAAPLNVEFIGDCRWLMGESMEAAVNGLGLNDVVRFIDPVPHAECLRRMREADLLLLLAQGQPLQVPNKLYEYLAVRIPILAFADKNGETTAMLRALGGHTIITDDDSHDNVDRAVHASLSAASPVMNQCDESMLLEWTTARQLDLLNASLESLLQ